MKVFLTGFDRFASLAFNPSELVVSEIGRLAQRSLTTELVVQVLPTEYDRAGEMVSEQVRRIRPEVVLGTGVSVSAPTICLERVALNIDDCDAADNAGSVRVGSPIDPHGPLALETTCDLRSVLERLQSRGFPSLISTHAGTYVCNHSYYMALRALKDYGITAKCMFVHFPLIAPAIRDCINSGAFSWTVSALVEAVQLIIVELINQSACDSKRQAGPD